MPPGSGVTVGYFNVTYLGVKFVEACGTKTES
jgi:hypothetical protein